jgi:hypothetical protein
MFLAEIAVNMLSGLAGVLGALAVFKWTRRKSEDAVLLDLHPVLGFLALTTMFATRAILMNLLVR